MNPASYDTAQFLVSGGISSGFGALSGWPVFINHEPSQEDYNTNAKVSDDCITIYDTGSEYEYKICAGKDPNPLENFNLQIRVRGVNYDTVYQKCIDIEDYLSQNNTLSLSGIIYQSFLANGSPIFLVNDVKGRTILVQNYRCMRQKTI